MDKCFHGFMVYIIMEHFGSFAVDFIFISLPFPKSPKSPTSP